jgi:chromatin remodeling complex protein RSC6
MTSSVVPMKKPAARKAAASAAPGEQKKAPRKPKAAKKSETVEVAVEEAVCPVVEAVVPGAAPVEEERPEGTTTEEVRMSRKQKQQQLLHDQVNALSALLEQEIADQKAMRNVDFVKVLKGFEKELKKTRTIVNKLAKTKKNLQNSNVEAGFSKPVYISKDVAKFTGWALDQPCSRVDVTKYICDYIAQNKLQNPENRRIIMADKKLSKLLGYDKEKDGDLDYARLQKFLKTHYTKI